MAYFNPFDPHSFFSDNFEGTDIDTEHVLRSTIFILTRLIAGYRVNKPESSPTDDQLKLWSNLSAILSTGVTGPVVAVTGIVHVQEQQLVIQSALVPANNDTRRATDAVKVRREEEQDRRSKSSKRREKKRLREEKQNRLSIEKLGIRSDEEVLNLLTYYKSSLPRRMAVSVKDHAQDVCAIVNYFLRVPEDRPSLYLANLTEFTIYRTRSLLSRRLKCGKNDWGDNPIRLIEAAWSPGNNGALGDWHGDKTISVRNRYVVRTLEDARIASSKSTSNLTEFSLTSSNGNQWARVLRDALERLEKQIALLKDVVGDSKGRELADSLLIVRGALVVIHEFVFSGVVDGLVTTKLAAELHAKYDEEVNKPNPEFKAGGLFKETPASEPGEAAETAEDHAEFKADLEDEGAAAHVRRYISSLAIPYSASKFLMQSLKKYSKGNVQMSMTLLTVRDLQTIDGVVVGQLKTALKKLSPSKTETIDELFERWRPNQKDNTIAVSIHAEAALMGAAYSDLKDDNLKSTIRIGVSKKCCFCCHLLGLELNKWRSGADDRSKRPEFVLPGGHSTVFPWLPPPGVPLKVLKNIRVELSNKLWELIQEGMHPPSAQTSPALSEQNLEDHIEFSPYDLLRIHKHDMNRA